MIALLELPHQHPPVDGLSNDTTTCACDQGFYLKDPLSDNYQCAPCPLYTTSVQNNTATNVLSCRCLAGYYCKYSQTVQGILYLNMTFSAFTDSAQEALKLAIAKAAGVDVSQVSIISIKNSSTGNRRLLDIDQNTLIITVSISGSQNNKIRKISRFSVVSSIIDHDTANEESSSFSDTLNLAWKLLRARPKVIENTKVMTQEFEILSETWTEDHSIQVTKIK